MALVFACSSPPQVLKGGLRSPAAQAQLKFFLKIQSIARSRWPRIQDDDAARLLRIHMTRGVMLTFCMASPTTTGNNTRPPINKNEANKMLSREKRSFIKLANYRYPGELLPRVGLIEETMIADLTGLIGAQATLESLLALEPDALRSLAARADQRRKLSVVELLPAIVRPSKIFCVGKNSRVHRAELVRENMLKEDPQEPTGFIKLPSTMVGEGASVRRPEGITSLDYEPELAFVISRPAYQTGRGDAHAVIGGITILNDLTARAIQRQEVASGTKFWTAKNMPGFCPTGPFVVPIWEIADPYDLWMTCTVNGQERLRVNTNEHIFRIDQIIEHFTRWMPFEPGDVISTGAPRGTAISYPNADELYLKPGDVCVAGIEGIMELTTHII